MVMVTVLLLSCFEFESGATVDPPMHIKSFEAQSTSVGVVWKFAEVMLAQVSSTSLDHGSKLRGPLPKALKLL
ncbi:hypothetical protein TNCV_4681691 [Trichonephila clavipes]|nr:hypothetical protein TNCV_4681691 [Trichonephila clavipes]